jgi:beta-glucanase (GH16 family)
VPSWGAVLTALVAQVCVVTLLTGMASAPRRAPAPRPARTASTAAASTAAAGTAWVPWNLVWYDAFSGRAGSGVSTQNWKYDTGQGVFGNNEVEDMTAAPGNVHLDGAGNLDITALNRSGRWTSGRIQTTRLFTAPAGGELQVAASIKLPDPAGGLGYWPAFWLLGAGRWPQDGEIDILEDVDTLSEHSGTLHCGNITTPNGDGTYGPCHEYTGLTSGLRRCSGCLTGYHSYSVVIDRRDAADEHIYWYLDGQEFFSISESQVGARVWTQAVDHGFSIIFDLAMGGNYPNGVCGCTTPTAHTTSGGTMSVDHVGVYQR